MKSDNLPIFFSKAEYTAIYQHTYALHNACSLYVNAIYWQTGRNSRLMELKEMWIHDYKLNTLDQNNSFVSHVSQVALTDTFLRQRSQTRFSGSAQQHVSQVALTNTFLRQRSQTHFSGSAHQHVSQVALSNTCLRQRSATTQLYMPRSPTLHNCSDKVIS